MRLIYRYLTLKQILLFCFLLACIGLLGASVVGDVHTLNHAAPLWIAFSILAIATVVLYYKWPNKNNLHDRCTGKSSPAKIRRRSTRA